MKARAESKPAKFASLLFALMLFLSIGVSLSSCSLFGGGKSKEEAPAAEGEISEEGGEEGGDAAATDGDDSMDDMEAEDATEKTLFDRIGGKKTLQLFADQFVNALASNPSLAKNPQIATAMKADQTRHKQMLVDYFCEKSGGPCKYTGKTMKDSHAALKISEADWKVLKVVFIRTLRQLKVPEQERRDLAKIAAKTKSQIVQKTK